VTLADSIFSWARKLLPASRERADADTCRRCPMRAWRAFLSNMKLLTASRECVAADTCLRCPLRAWRAHRAYANQNPSAINPIASKNPHHGIINCKNIPKPTKKKIPPSCCRLHRISRMLRLPTRRSLGSDWK